MLTTIGYGLSGLIAVLIIAIGVRFLVAPWPAAASFGVPINPAPGSGAYLAAKGVRDIALGLLAGLLIATRSAHLLGWFVLVAALIPAADAAIVLRHDGSRAAAFGVHGGTLVVMLVTSALLLAS